MSKKIIVMGVSGCGKSTVGQAIADALQATFYDGDDFHPQANVDKMASGTPLNDDDRRPWLETLAQTIHDTRGNSVTACSALKKQYRDILRNAGDLTFIFLEGDKQTLLERIQERSNNTTHFMPSSLLDSQLATLESPTAETGVITVSIHSPISKIIEDVLQQL
ncbi:gluconokinase [Rubritalea spongiae]|uniref:Gluconokinase n=1 Tax=Rubritalea spongiae TaxID=430797 RepID=A0ABW5E432_9BACT